MAVPTVALAVAEKETLTVQFALQGLPVKEAVTPDGNTDAMEKVIDRDVLEIALIEEELLTPFRTTVKLLGEGVEREKVIVAAAFGMLTTIADKIITKITRQPGRARIRLKPERLPRIS